MTCYSPLGNSLSRMKREVGVKRMPQGLRHVALSISFLSPMARRPDAFFAMKMASLILRPDLRFLALTSFQSFSRPSFSSGSSSRISLRRQSFSVSRARLRPPGNIHSRSRLLLTNRTRPRFAATSFDAFAITYRLTRSPDLIRSVAQRKKKAARGSPNTKYRSRSALLQERASKLVSGGGDLTTRVEPAMIGCEARHLILVAAARQHLRKP